MSDMFARLAAEFPREAVHWRAQTLTQNGDKALALAYLDARDVMDRLDDVCGPAGWQNSYVETPKGRVIATISILVDGVWIAKSDGAGDTAVEGEKGGVSDALKRAAVCWGIGRYLYRLPSVWAPCESYERGGKKHWKAWRGSPWDSVRGFTGVSPAVADAVVDDHQWAELTTLISQTGVSAADVCADFGIASLKDLPVSRYPVLRRNLMKRLLPAKEAA